MSDSRSSDPNDAAANATANAIAIVGMAGRFPGARDVGRFWRNLLDGVESVTWFSDEQLREAGESERNLRDPSYVKANPVLEDIEHFDAGFFGFSPLDAAIMDPAHRLFLEVAWQALEHAGHTAYPDEGAVGVFATSGASLYLMDHLRTNPHLMETVGDFLLRHTGNDASFLATRVSYELDLRGPSINVQTACSSALVAVHMACQSLLSGECDMALAGGSTILLPQRRGYLFREGEILARDGHCRPFDAQATGTVFGSGVGAVVLARLGDAIANRDTVYAVIRGAAVNNDGSVKVGYLAPSVDSQAACIAEALAVSGVEPSTVSYVEAHGTGTRVGDPIEVTALTQAFRRFTDELGFCALGSVKANVGHLGEAAGIAALIKAVLSLHHGELPPSLGFEQPNEQIDFAESPFFVNTQRRAWRPRSGVRRAGITALGAGGTNCHVVLEQAPTPEVSGADTGPRLLVWSAKTPRALDELSSSLADALEDPGVALADVAYTLQVGRRPLSHRRALVAGSRDEARALLRSPDPSRVLYDVCEGKARRTAFLFPGGGSQYARMGAELYAKEACYRESFDACLACLDADKANAVRALVLASEGEAESASRQLERPSLALPALFATEYALAELFRAWGLEADTLCGHSMGEYVVACFAGVFTLRTAMQLVALRGLLFERVQRGGMLAVSLPHAELEKLFLPGLDIAAVNAPGLCVASGPVEQIEALARELTLRDVDSTRIHIEVAAHSAMLDPILPEFRAFCRTVQWSAPKARFVSNLTGTWITDQQATDPEYWVSHLRSTVRFAQCLETLLAEGIEVFVEVGPGRALTGLARAQKVRPALACESMRHPQQAASDLEFALSTLGRAWAAGARVDWSKLGSKELRRRIPLPVYPFEPTPYWIEPGAQPAIALQPEAPLRKRVDPERWFSTLSWSRAVAPVARAWGGSERFLVFVDKAGVGRDLIERLGIESATMVVPGRALIRRKIDEYEIDPEDPAQFDTLVRELHEAGRGPTHVVYLWTLGLPDARYGARGLARTAERLEGRFRVPTGFASSRAACFAAPFHLCRSLGAYGTAVELTLVTSNAHSFGDEVCDPHKALAFGPVLVAPHEFPMVRSRTVDVTAVWTSGARRRRLVDQLAREVSAAPDERVVALRGPDRWVRRVEPCRPPAALPSLPLRERACVLVSGGLGGIGLEIAGALARAPGITLVLIGRAGLPERSTWDSWLREHVAEDATSNRIRRVRALEAAGARVVVQALDVSDEDAVRRLFGELSAGGVAVTGVVHAAGHMEDALLLEKTLADAWRVLSAKVDGALALDAASAGHPLDFFVVFSSVASYLGLPGQADYTAANAFLDAFAARRTALGRGRTLAINWNAWRDVGMAAALSLPRAQRELAQLPVEPSKHADFGGFVRTRDGFLFFADLSLGSHWIVGEHRVRGGHALVPGTGHLELIAAAAREVTRAGTVRIRDVRFIAPFQVENDAPRRLFLRLVRADGGHEVRIFADDETMPCVTARVEGLDTPLSRVVPLHELRGGACPDVEEIHGLMRQQFVDFGPRWSNLVRASYGSGQALIELELPDSLRGDLRAHPFHPALADMATGSAQKLIPGFDPSSQFFVPISYDSVDFHAPLPERFVSHVRYVGGSAGQTAVFDVSLAEETGRVLVEVRGFTMRRVGQAAAIVARAETSAAPKTPQAERVAELLEQAISPEEGAGAFLRALGSFSGVQCTISSVDPVAWLRQLDLDAERSLQAPGQRAAGFARPSLRTPYVAPSTPEEEVVARIWSELLGIQDIGVNDDFGELGGQSLLAIRMVERIKRETGAQLALSTLFDAPTVARVAAKLGSRGRPARAHHSIVPVREGGNHPPLFMPHGVGGTVHWGYANLAKHLDPRVPVIGLKVAPEDRVTFEDMCAFYVSEIREVQPKGPYFLGGYCYGGNVAFEIARQLRDAGEEVALLALIEAWPVNTEFGKVEWSPGYAARFAENLPYFVSDFAARPRRDQWEAIQRKVGRLKERVLGPAPAATASATSGGEESLFDRLGPPPPGADLLDIRAIARYGEGEMLVWERCIRALWQNVPRPIDVHGLVIRTRRQPLFSPLEPEMGWRPLLTRGLDAHTVAGSHFTIMDMKDVVAVAEILNAEIERANGSHPPANASPLPVDAIRAGAKR